MWEGDLGSKTLLEVPVLWYSHVEYFERGDQMTARVLQSKLGMAAGMLVILAMLGSACGPSEAPSASPSPEGNQPPAISSLTAEQMQTHPLGEIKIQCVASDPDGDKVTFEWACSKGKFGDTSPTIVTWEAPKEYGDYDIMVTVEDDDGATAQASLTLSVVANQNPQITSLDADPKTVGPEGSSKVTCLASDPDGDKVSYSWSTGDGEISGIGDKVTWDAPDKGGTYEVTVLVSDGKGGETTGYVTVTVAVPSRTVTINAVAEATGSVSSGGDRDTSRTVAGDDEDNTGYRAFWSFDITDLIGTEIGDAKLEFATKSSNDDAFQSAGFGALGGLKLWAFHYGEGGLPKDFNIKGGKLDATFAVIKAPPVVVDVTHEITYLAQVKDASLFQVEALFVKATNGNGSAELIEWSDVTLTVTYSEK